jgi:hypothetical protein
MASATLSQVLCIIFPFFFFLLHCTLIQEKSKPLSLLCRHTFPTISKTLTLPFSLSPSCTLIWFIDFFSFSPFSLCRLPFLSLRRNGSGHWRRRTGLALPPSLVSLSHTGEERVCDLG